MTEKKILVIGAQIMQIPELVYKANPETYIRSIAPPFFIQHGTHDNIVSHQQSVNSAAKLADVIDKDKVALELLPNAQHADPAFETPQNVKKVLDFLDSLLRL
jgi:acetyl esterase/lipase